MDSEVMKVSQKINSKCDPKDPRGPAMLSSHPLHLLFLLIYIPSLIVSQSDLLDEANPIFIRFNGSLSAHFTPSPSLSSQCHSFNIIPVRASTIYVGIYPDWDPNPFFFQISHGHSEDCAPADCPWEYYHPSLRRKRAAAPREKRQGFVFDTYDQLYQLDFASTYYVCEKDGELCGSVEWDPSYIGARMLDLRLASVRRVAVGDEMGYTVQGDERTWVSNSTANSSFYLGEDHVLLADPPATTCLEQPDRFFW